MMVKDKEPPKRRGLHSAAKIEQLITSHKEKAQWNTPPTPLQHPPPQHPHPQCLLCNPSSCCSGHTHTHSYLAWAAHGTEMIFFFFRRRIKLQFIFSPQPQFTSSTLHDSKGIGFQCDGFIRAVSRWKNYRIDVFFSFSFSFTESQWLPPAYVAVMDKSLSEILFPLPAK